MVEQEAFDPLVKRSDRRSEIDDDTTEPRSKRFGRRDACRKAAQQRSAFVSEPTVDSTLPTTDTSLPSTSPASDPAETVEAKAPDTSFPPGKLFDDDAGREPASNRQVMKRLETHAA